MNNIPNETLPAIRNKQELTVLPKRSKAVVISQSTDTFNPKPKITVQGYAAAGLGAAGFAGSVYKLSKGVIEKGTNWIEKEITNYFREMGKNYKGLPNGLKVNSKYFGAGIAAIAAGLLFFKDSDKDGQLDILEAGNKFANPDSGN